MSALAAPLWVSSDRDTRRRRRRRPAVSCGWRPCRRVGETKTATQPHDPGPTAITQISA